MERAGASSRGAGPFHFTRSLGDEVGQVKRFKVAGKSGGMVSLAEVRLTWEPKTGNRFDPPKRAVLPGARPVVDEIIAAPLAAGETDLHGRDPHARVFRRGEFPRDAADRH